MKVYGPYKRKDGRSHVIIVNDDGTKTTQSYPRFLMEQYLGRKLSENEQVDQLLTQFDNLQKSRYRLPQAQLKACICPQCNKEFMVSLSQYQNNQLKQERAGPFCSRSCAGKWSTGSTATTYHGTNSGYTNHKCRCDLCRQAHREYKRTH